MMETNYPELHALSEDAKPNTISENHDVSNDPFYSEKNINYLRKVIADIEAGRATMEMHDLLEE